MSQTGPRKFRCRIGLHRWYYDCTLFSSAKVCDLCGNPADPEEYAELVAERGMWESASQQGMDFNEAGLFVLKQKARADRTDGYDVLDANAVV